jgi:hypothetical protein
MNGFDKTCESCGTPVKVVGDVTKHYESAYEIVKADLDFSVAEREALKHEIEELKKALMRAHDP